MTPVRPHELQVGDYYKCVAWPDANVWHVRSDGYGECVYKGTAVIEFDTTNRNRNGIHVGTRSNHPVRNNAYEFLFKVQPKVAVTEWA